MEKFLLETFYFIFRMILPLYFIVYLAIYKSKNRNANLLFGVGSMTILTYFNQIKNYILDPNYLKRDAILLDNINLFIALFLFLIFGFLPILMGMFLILKNRKE